MHSCSLHRPLELFSVDPEDEAPPPYSAFPPPGPKGLEDEGGPEWRSEQRRQAGVQIRRFTALFLFLWSGVAITSCYVAVARGAHWDDVTFLAVAVCVFSASMVLFVFGRHVYGYIVDRGIQEAVTRRERRRIRDRLATNPAALVRLV